MNSEYAKVILDSIAPNGKRLTTLEVRYWRAIHSEFMTHRMLSRNSASSRAIPFERSCKNCNGQGIDCSKCGGSGVDPKCTLGMLFNDPFIPEYIGKEQKGMQSGAELEGPERQEVEVIIQNLKGDAITAATRLAELGVHKSIINRYLEPWSYITVVVTATEWKNFFKLRCHPAAEKHLQKVANLMKQAMDESAPKWLKFGEWHTPYIQPGEVFADNETRNHVSIARSARVSFLTQDGRRSIDDDLELYERLRYPGDGVIHASPFEHVAMALAKADALCQSGNLRGWEQYRKTIKGEDGND